MLPLYDAKPVELMVTIALRPFAKDPGLI